MSNLYCLNEAQMERLRPYSPKSQGVPRVDKEWPYTACEACP
jgi:hypothetical protein